MEKIEQPIKSILGLYGLILYGLFLLWISKFINFNKPIDIIILSWLCLPITFLFVWGLSE